MPQDTQTAVEQVDKTMFVTDNQEILSQEQQDEMIKISATVQEKMRKLSCDNGSMSQAEFYSDQVENEIVARDLDDATGDLVWDYMGWFVRFQSTVDGSDSLDRSMITRFCRSCCTKSARENN